MVCFNALMRPNIGITNLIFFIDAEPSFSQSLIASHPKKQPVRMTAIRPSKKAAKIYSSSFANYGKMNLSDDIVTCIQRINKINGF